MYNLFWLNTSGGNFCFFRFKEIDSEMKTWIKYLLVKGRQKRSGEWIWQMEDNLSLSYNNGAAVGYGQTHCVDYWQIYRRTCVCSFRIYKCTVRCKTKCASLADPAAGSVQPLAKNTLMSRGWTPGSLSQCTMDRTSAASSTPAWKNELRLRVFDSWLDLRCHISLTPHVPVFGAIKTNKTLPRNGRPTVPPFKKLN